MKPKLLLHSCCAPCSSSVIEKLSENFDLTIFYYNPNIYPLIEYEQRLNEQIQFLKKLDIPIICGKYETSNYKNAISGLENLPEKSNRCYNCYKFRLQKTLEVAKQNNFEFFTTTLSVSPHKNAQWINEIGKSLESENCKFLVADFKKQNGYLRSLELSKKYNFYRQNYCGCKMSYLSSLNKINIDKK